MENSFELPMFAFNFVKGSRKITTVIKNGEKCQRFINFTVPKQFLNQLLAITFIFVNLPFHDASLQRGVAIATAKQTRVDLIPDYQLFYAKQRS